MTSEAKTTDFSHLPDVTFAEVNAAEVEEKAINTFEAASGRTLFPGDPMRITMTTLAALFTQYMALLDQTGKRNLLRYAGADDLPHLGALLDVTQLDATFATTNVLFTVREPVPFSVTIPTGTRVTADAKLFFATTESGIIPAGEPSVELPVKALEPGEAANGLVPGQIIKLVDQLQVVISVTNTMTTSGGSDVEDLESLRTRIYLAPESFSCAGPELAYKFHALSAHPGLADVEVYSPTPGVVEIVLLLAGGQIPDPDGQEVEAVIEALSAEKVRPLTDDVRVIPAVAVDFDYCFTYFLHKDKAAFKDQLHLNMKDAAAAYEAWQTGKIGRDINDDKLKSVCQAAGAKRIVAERTWRDETGTIVHTEPMTFQKLVGNQVARIPAASDRVIFGGIEDY